MGSEPPVVVFDASVLFSFPTAHILTFMAQRRVVIGRWTRHIEAEWVERCLEKNPGLMRASVERRRDLMNEGVPDARVVGYEPLIPDIGFPDAKDRHVVAAAIRSGAVGIVTRDRKHFNDASLAPYGLIRLDPDDLLCRRLQEEEAYVRATVEMARTALTKTKPDPRAYAALLRKAGFDGLADRLEAAPPAPPP